MEAANAIVLLLPLKIARLIPMLLDAEEILALTATIDANGIPLTTSADVLLNLKYVSSQYYTINNNNNNKGT